MPDKAISDGTFSEQAERLIADGKTAAAATLLRKHLRDHPADAAARALMDRLRLTTASARLPADARTAVLQMQSALAAGRHAEVVTAGQKLMQIYPRLAAAPNLMGVALFHMGRPNDAIRGLNHAVALEPACPDPYVNLSAVLRETGQIQAAYDAILAAAAVDPGLLAAHLNAGVIAEDLGHADEAAAHYARALELDPASVDAHDAMCRFLEARNRLDALARAVERAIAATNGAPQIRLREGQLQFRTGALQEARATFEAIDERDLPPEARIKRAELLGKLCDQLADHDAAFAAFSAMNETRAKLLGLNRAVPPIYLRELNMLLDGVRADDKAPDWLCETVSDHHSDPAFLVGFPRSGTTLLDTILRSHPQVAVAEEKPFVHRLRKGIPVEDEFARLAGLRAEDIARGRDAYFEAFRDDAGPLGDGAVLVDKLPLNLRDAAVIRRFFPNARFILALRHPCDCVLSCFMQNFRPNPAMNSFLSLENTARVYDRIFALWSAYQELLGLDVVTIRYEDVVSDLRAAVEPVLGFLGQDWSDALLDYRSTAGEREKIRTPSYRQVTQEIYTSADGRWRRYEKQLAEVLPVLEPWIERWGYSA